MQHARLPCPSPSPKVYPSSCPLNQWCHLNISSSVTLFFCLQSYPASGSFPMSQLFASGGQSTGASASAPVLLQSIQDWFLLILTGLISLLSNCSRHAIYPDSLSLGTTSPTSWGGLPAVMFLLHNPAPLTTSDRFHGAYLTTMSVQLGKLASLSWGSVRNLLTLLVEIWKEGLQTPGSEGLDLLYPHPFFPSLVIPWNAYSTMVSFQ